MCGRHRSTTPTTLIRDDDIRASDTERERIVEHLRAAAGDGRLALDELDRRIDAAYAATTRRDLAALTKDLPRPRRDRSHERREHVRSYVGVMALLVVIWALTGMGYFWPIWPIVCWGVFVLPDAMALRRPPRRRLAARV